MNKQRENCGNQQDTIAFIFKTIMASFIVMVACPTPTAMAAAAAITVAAITVAGLKIATDLPKENDGRLIGKNKKGLRNARSLSRQWCPCFALPYAAVSASPAFNDVCLAPLYFRQTPGSTVRHQHYPQHGFLETYSVQVRPSKWP